MPLDVEREVAALQQMPTGQLSECCAELFGEQTRSRHRTYLIRKVAWKLPQAAVDEVVHMAIKHGHPSLVQSNRAFHKLLIDGVKIEFTDRSGKKDTDNAQSIVYSAAKELLRPSLEQAEGREQLWEMLGARKSGGIIFTTVQKFTLLSVETAHPVLYDRRNVW